MLYNAEIKNAILDTLNNKVSSIANIVSILLEEGYIPNKNKGFKLQVALMLSEAFINIDVLSIDKHKKLENLYNKFITL